MEKYIAQIFGALALIMLFTSYQKKTKKDFFIVQIFANLFYALQYILLKAYSGTSASVVAILRSVVFYDFENKDKQIPVFVLLIFELIFILVGIFTFEGIYSTIPILIHCIYTLGTWFKSLKTTYIIAIISAILWTVYSLMVGAYVSIIANFVELTAGILGLRRLKTERNESKC